MMLIEPRARIMVALHIIFTDIRVGGGIAGKGD